MLIASFLVIRDDIKTKKQIQANVDAVLNSPKMQEYRARQERRQREIAKQKRFRELGIEGISQPMQKNDLLNQQLKRQAMAQEEEKTEIQTPQGVDYSAEVAAYKARLAEVRAEEARIRAEEARRLAEAEAAAKARAEQERLEAARQQAEQKRLAEARAKQEAAAKAQAAKEKAARERAAKIKAAQERAAQTKARLEALKTQKNTLQSRSSEQAQTDFDEM